MKLIVAQIATSFGVVSSTQLDDTIYYKVTVSWFKQNNERFDFHESSKYKFMKYFAQQ